MTGVQWHGIVSVLLVIAAMLIGFIAILHDSVLHALCYSTIIMIAYCVIAAVYCSKCCCRNKCNHIFVGNLSKMLSKPNDAPYTNRDMFYGTALPIATTIILPQYWLIKIPSLFFAFWLFLLIGAAEIILFVCKGCKNTKCSMSK